MFKLNKIKLKGKDELVDSIKKSLYLDVIVFEDIYITDRIDKLILYH